MAVGVVAGRVPSEARFGLLAPLPINRCDRPSPAQPPQREKQESWTFFPSVSVFVFVFINNASAFELVFQAAPDPDSFLSRTTCINVDLRLARPSSPPHSPAARTRARQSHFSHDGNHRTSLRPPRQLSPPSPEMARQGQEGRRLAHGL